MNKENIWLISDTHFGHANILQHCPRPFSSIEEMDQQLIVNWNNTVGDKDHIFHLGDFAFCNPKTAIEIRKQLKGQIYLVKGNHDKTAERLKKYFQWIKDYYELKVKDDRAIHSGGKQKIILFHYALRTWNNSHHSSLHAWGHSHSNLADDPHARSMDVGVDNTAKRLGGKPEDYRPISYEEFRTEVMKKEFKPVDHHA